MSHSGYTWEWAELRTVLNKNLKAWPKHTSHGGSGTQQHQSGDEIRQVHYTSLHGSSLYLTLWIVHLCKCMLWCCSLQWCVCLSNLSRMAQTHLAVLEESVTLSYQANSHLKAPICLCANFDVKLNFGWISFSFWSIGFQLHYFQTGDINSHITQSRLHKCILPSCAPQMCSAISPYCPHCSFHCILF